MEIEANIAQNIIDKLKNIVGKEINFISTEGVIIASTDKNRIGTIHEGAKVAINNKKTLIINNDDQFKGAKKGINSPVYVDEELVAIIGVTGANSEMIQLCEVIKEMTEVLLKENWLKTLRFHTRINHKILLDEISLRDSSNQSILDLANILNVDLAASRFLIHGKFYKKSMETIENVEDIYSSIDNFFFQNNQIIFSVTSNHITIAYPSENLNSCISICNKISEILYSVHGLNSFFGIGTRANTIKSLKESNKKALVAMNWNNQVINEYIVTYDSLDLGLLFPYINRNYIREYIDKIFKPLSKDEISEYNEIFLLYEEYNGSIYKCANELFIHKNTFQYKLNTFQEKTGLDFRNLNDYLLISLTFKLINYLEYV